MIEILENPRFSEAEVFEDDFNEIAKYFVDILENKSWSALPGGIVDTYVPAADRYNPITLCADDFRGYKMDTGRYIASNKTVIAGALALIEGRALGFDEFTLCPSVSFGLLIVFLVLKQKKIRTLISELPSYFACIEQADALDFRVMLWPALPDEGYAISARDLDNLRAAISEPVAVLLTQPRYGMGYCRSNQSVQELFDILRAGDVLIVDEAADQSVPSPLAKISPDGEKALIRVRGLTKGLGLNSAKVAAIFHPPQLRSIFGDTVDFAGGALDAASLTLITSLCEEPSRYISLLQAAQTYVRSRKREFEQRLLGLPIVLSPLESGYIGTAHIKFDESFGAISGRRSKFLELCKNFKMPVVLGSSMYFPYAPQQEIIRVNYFTTAENLRASANVLTKIMKSMR
jgi:aspartate/methionine/tyrosine aminotransferase